jgi:hypothetical protein
MGIYRQSESTQTSRNLERILLLGFAVHIGLAPKKNRLWKSDRNSKETPQRCACVKQKFSCREMVTISSGAPSPAQAE